MLADLHYGKAAKLFQLLKDAPCELLRVQLERVAFAEFQMTSKYDFSNMLYGGCFLDCLRGKLSCVWLLDISKTVFLLIFLVLDHERSLHTF